MSKCQTNGLNILLPQEVQPLYYVRFDQLFPAEIRWEISGITFAPRLDLLFGDTEYTSQDSLANDILSDNRPFPVYERVNTITNMTFSTSSRVNIDSKGKVI